MRKEKKYHYIYKTTNLKNGKFYIGMHSTNDLNDGYLGSGLRLRRSIRRNGIENFKIEHLEFFHNRIDLANRETELVNGDLLKDPMCMNLMKGGYGIDSDRAKVLNLSSQKSQKWLRENDKEWYSRKIEVQTNAIRRSYENPNRNRKINYDWNGKTHNEETKKKIGLANSIKQQGTSNSQFGTCWITNEIQNKKIKKEDIIPDGWRLGRV